MPLNKVKFDCTGGIFNRSGGKKGVIDRSQFISISSNIYSIDKMITSGDVAETVILSEFSLTVWLVNKDL